MTTAQLQKRLTGYVVAMLGVLAVALALKPFAYAVNHTTVALAMLLVILFAAAIFGSRPAIAASVLAVFCFNFFFLPPVGTLTIADPDNWIALAAFLITAITAGQLSASARRRAEEAEQGRRQIERLYNELRGAFERASHAEALRQSERLKSALLDAVTHDLRTPLTSIKVSVSTLLEDAREDKDMVALEGQERREMLNVIDEECDRLNHFVEGLVELARIEAGELSLRRRWGNIEEIIATTLSRAGKITSNHKVEVEIEKELPAARVDARAVSEVLYTLVENAAKYSEAATSIYIRAARADDEAIKMSVEDSGRGIPLELRERVFEKFFRAKSLPQGLGMGLAIAKGIIEAHGGRIWIEDGVGGRGARVTFTLPIGDDETAAQSEHIESTLQATDQPGLAGRIK